MTIALGTGQRDSGKNTIGLMIPDKHLWPFLRVNRPSVCVYVCILLPKDLNRDKHRVKKKIWSCIAASMFVSLWNREKKLKSNPRSICRSTRQWDGALKSTRGPLKFQPQGDRKQITAQPSHSQRWAETGGMKERWY